MSECPIGFHLYNHSFLLIFVAPIVLRMKALPLIILSAIATFSLSMAFLQQENPQIKVNYPKTRKDKVQETHFGKKIEDPYRWLENDTAKEVKKWVDAQIATTESYLSQIPYRNKIKNRLEEIFNYPKYGLDEKGELLFPYKK